MKSRNIKKLSVSNVLLGNAQPAEVVSVISRDLGQVYTPSSNFEFGVDGFIEPINEGDRERAPWQRIGVQFSRGVSRPRETRFGRTLYCSQQLVSHWSDQAFPIIVVDYEPETERLRWRQADNTSLRRTGRGFAVDLSEKSDLRTALPALRELGVAAAASILPSDKVFSVPYELGCGVIADSEELGRAGLKFSQEARRGQSFRVEIEIIGEAELIANVDVIRDLAEPTAEQRKDADKSRHILDGWKPRIPMIKRALSLLLTEPRIAGEFKSSATLMATAIRRTVHPDLGNRKGGDISLRARPLGEEEKPFVSFDIPGEGADEFAPNHVKMGWGRPIKDLPRELFLTRFIPSLAHRIRLFADANQLDDRAALDVIGPDLKKWWLESS